MKTTQEMHNENIQNKDQVLQYLQDAINSFDKSMEGRAKKVIDDMFDLMPSRERAIKAILNKGWSMKDIREAGYDV